MDDLSFNDFDFDESINHINDSLRYALDSYLKDYNGNYVETYFKIPDGYSIDFDKVYSQSAAPNPTMWPYPNGAMAPTRPSHGEIYITWDNSGFPKFIHQWDDVHVQWIDVSANHNYGNVPINVNITLDPPDLNFDLEKEFKNSLRCECGAEKCGSNKHSTWCQKFGY